MHALINALKFLIVALVLIVVLIGLSFREVSLYEESSGMCGGAVGFCGYIDVFEDRKFPVEGRQIYENNCHQCHSLGNNVVVGPGLNGVLRRRSRAWTKAFIRNSQQMIAEGDTQALQVYKEYNRQSMPAFEAFRDEQLEFLLNFLDDRIYTGERVFEQNCARCHSAGEETKIGPPLFGISLRRTMPWIKSFVQDSQKMIAEGDSLALRIFDEYNQQPMPSFDLRAEEMEQLMMYLERL